MNATRKTPRAIQHNPALLPWSIRRGRGTSLTVTGAAPSTTAPQAPTPRSVAPGAPAIQQNPSRRPWSILRGR